MLLLICGCFFVCAAVTAEESEGELQNTQARIQTLFNQLEVAGNSYNGGGNKTALNSVMMSGCSAMTGSSELQAYFNHHMQGLIENAGLPAAANAYGLQLGQQGVGRLLSSGCTALSGQDVTTDTATMISGFGDQMVLGLLQTGQGWANQSGLPFLSRLELETGSERGQWVTSVTTIQPLWKDKDERHHVFTQLAWRQVDGEKTVNSGLAYRRLSDDKAVFYGANLFFDHGFEMNHNRMSIGADVQTSVLGGSINRYIPLSDWRTRDDGLWEEKAAAGWDLELTGQVPDLPSWTGSIKGYQWDGSDNQSDDPANQIDKTYGYLASLEYAPVPAFAMRGGFRQENDGESSGELALRLNLRFNEPLHLQFKPRIELTSVEDRIYQKVSRENTIRIQERRKASGLVTVIETVGANSVTGQAAATSLSTGQTLTLPATITVANTGGAYARIRFAHGGILTIGQNSIVTIEPELITLVSGTMQYISGSTNVVVNVPGGTVNLLGTDIDIVSNGTNSTVRVREGSVRLDGTSSGSATIGAMQMAQSIAGVVSTVASGTATYVTHTDDVSIKIDRSANAVVGVKVAPYPVDPPRLLNTATSVGQTLVIGLAFNTAVTVSGGTPRLTFVLNGNTRTASLSGGSGTSDLQFSYVLQAGDGGAGTNLTITGFDNNGAAITGDGKAAVTTIADTTLELGATVGSTPSLVMNFLTNTYELLGTTYNSLSSFLTAASGTFTRSSIATYFDANGNLQTAATGVPRFDHDPVTHAPRGILIESQRTNNIRSSQLTGIALGGPYTVATNLGTNGHWLATPAGGIPSSSMSIVGTGTIGNIPYIDIRFQVNNTGNTVIAYQNFRTQNAARLNVSAGQQSIASAWLGIIAYSRTGTPCGLRFSNRSYGSSQTENNSFYGSVTPFQRRTTPVVTYPAGATNGDAWIYVDVAPGATCDMTVRLGGMQHEIGGFATSYIPTTNGTVTRAADNLVIPTSSGWYNAAQGNVLAQYLSTPPVLRQVWALSDGSFNNLINLSCNALNTTCHYAARVGNANQYTLNDVNSAFSAARKTAISYNANAYAISTNGAAALTTSSGSIPSGVSMLSVGRRGDAVEWLNGHMQNFSYTPAAATNATLQTQSAP